MVETLREREKVDLFTMQTPIIFVFGILGNIVSFLVYLSPAPTFHRIVKKKSTEGFECVPYVVALLSSMLWIYYATLKSNETLLITINSIGCFIETIYISMYIIYASKQARLRAIKLSLVLDIIGFGSILLFTLFFLEGPQRVEVLGWISVTLSASVYIAPLTIMKQVIRTKSVEFMPISLSLALLLNAVMWFFYGLLLKDIYIAVPNTVGFIFGLLQIILYGIYKNSKIDYAEEHKLPTAIKPESTSNCEQIHPVCSPPIKDLDITVTVSVENVVDAQQSTVDSHDQPN
ncbi:bidirectional sugar transporter SWEET14-like [Salvia splendens]|uniref:bidirectional sugar transporter SWEET14-like n=1 Tax=Salvia splendens TaxID=180675 RepID=UPI001C256BDA|nr:bidirectional sugar transporter SWEET14-like [Salvia splendens]